MNFRLVFQTISWLIALEGVAVGLCSGVAYLMGDSRCDIFKLLACGGIAAAAGMIGIFVTRKASGQPGFREGFAVVTFGWLLISIFGALPFSLVVGMKWYDAVFETVSGFTTTGASVISSDLQLYSGYALPQGIESLPKGILFWRALTHWIGGMGIVVFSLAILPMLGKGGQALYNAEVPGVKTRSDQFTPRIASTAKILLLVYCGLTLVETILLFFCGMTLFDAVCHSFATISTGGFSTKNDSIALNYVLDKLGGIDAAVEEVDKISNYISYNDSVIYKDYRGREYRAPGTVSCYDMSNYMAYMYREFINNSQINQRLINDLAHNEIDSPLKDAFPDGTRILHVLGRNTDRGAYLECAIVDYKEPFVLIIYVEASSPASAGTAIATLGGYTQKYVEACYQP